jgi:hypothetical protein
MAVGLLPWALAIMVLSQPRGALLPSPGMVRGEWLVLVAVGVVVAVYGYERLLAAATELGVRLNDEPEMDTLVWARIHPLPADRAARRAWLRYLKADPGARAQAEQSLVGALAAAVTVAGPAMAAAKTLEEFQDRLRRAIGSGAVDADAYRKRLLDLLNRFQGRINDEYTDVASRTGWLLTSQAFLLAALVATLNAGSLDPVLRHWIAQGVGFAGAIFAFALALGLFHGHALIAQLKQHRDALERVAHRDFGVPRAGVPVTAFVHLFGHSATKFLPAFAYLAWVVLALAVSRGVEHRAAPTGALPHSPAVIQAPLAATGLDGRAPSFGTGARVSGRAL